MNAKRNMKTVLLILTFVCLIGWLGYIRIWPKQVKTGMIKVDTYTKIQLVLGLVNID